MIRNLQKILTISLMFILLMSVTCYAEDIAEVVSSDTIETVPEETTTETAELTQEKQEEASEAETTPAETTGTISNEIVRNDVYLIDATVNYDKTVDGNAYIMGNDITFGSVIGGDVYILGNTVKISKDALIYGNLYVLANTLQIDGYVYGGDLYAACSQLIVSQDAAINRDIRVTAGSINFDGGVGRNIYSSSNSITIGETAQVLGDLNYSSPEAVEIPAGVVKGKINYSQSDSNSGDSAPVLTYVISLAQFVVLVMVIFAITVFIAPKFLKRVEKAGAKSILPSLGIGLIGLIATLPLAILLLVSMVGTSVGFALISSWSFLIFNLATPISLIAIAGLLASKFEALSKSHNVLAVIIVTLVTWLLELIPFVGSIIALLLAVYGFGLIITTVWKSRKEENGLIQDNKEN